MAASHVGMARSSQGKSWASSNMSWSTVYVGSEGRLLAWRLAQFEMSLDMIRARVLSQKKAMQRCHMETSSHRFMKPRISPMHMLCPS